MTVKQRVALVLTVLLLAGVIGLFVWYLQRPEETPNGILVYHEAYLRIADQPWQGEQLCHRR